MSLFTTKGALITAGEGKAWRSIPCATSKCDYPVQKPKPARCWDMREKEAVVQRGHYPQKGTTAQGQHVKGQQDGCLGCTFPPQQESIPLKCSPLRHHQGKYVLFEVTWGSCLISLGLWGVSEAHVSLVESCYSTWYMDFLMPAISRQKKITL